MPTLLTNTFKNNFLNVLIGKAAYNSATFCPYKINFFNGTQPAVGAGGTTGAGLSAFAAPTTVFSAASFTAAGQGKSQLEQPSVFTPNATYTTTGFTWARLYNNSDVALFDVAVSTIFGGGGIILSSVNSTAGSPIQITNFRVQVPTNVGTVYFGEALINRMCDCITGVGSPVAPDLVGSGSMLTAYACTTIPTSADFDVVSDPVTYPVVGDVSLDSSYWNAASGGSLALTTALVGYISCDTDGTVKFARVVNGSFVMQGTIGTSAKDFITNADTWNTSTAYNLTTATFVLV